MAHTVIPPLATLTEAIPPVLVTSCRVPWVCRAGQSACEPMLRPGSSLLCRPVQSRQPGGGVPAAPEGGGHGGG